MTAAAEIARETVSAAKGFEHETRNPRRFARKRDQLEGKIQERYGIDKDAARKHVDDWVNKQ